jgi:hypothetical protein
MANRRRRRWRSCGGITGRFTQMLRLRGHAVLQFKALSSLGATIMSAY